MWITDQGRNLLVSIRLNRGVVQTLRGPRRGDVLPMRAIERIDARHLGHFEAQIPQLRIQPDDLPDHTLVRSAHAGDGEVDQFPQAQERRQRRWREDVARGTEEVDAEIGDVGVEVGHRALGEHRGRRDSAA